MKTSLKLKFLELFTLIFLFVTAQVWADSDSTWWFAAFWISVLVYGIVCEALGRAKESELRTKITAAGLEELP